MKELIIESSLNNRISLDNICILYSISLNDIPKNLKEVRLYIGGKLIYLFNDFIIGENFLGCRSLQYSKIDLEFIFDDNILLTDKEDYFIDKSKKKIPIYSEDWNYYINEKGITELGKQYLYSEYEENTKVRFYDPNVTIKYKDIK